MVYMGMRQQHVVDVRGRKEKWLAIQIAAVFALMHAAVHKNLLIGEGEQGV